MCSSRLETIKITPFEGNSIAASYVPKNITDIFGHNGQKNQRMKPGLLLHLRTSSKSLCPEDVNTRL